MLGVFKERYRLWKKWKLRNLNGSLYKLFVLLGLVVSPTFQMMPQIDEFEKEHNDLRIVGYEDGIDDVRKEETYDN